MDIPCLVNHFFQRLSRILLWNTLYDMSVDTEYTAKEVAAHRERDDAWMVINGEGEQLQGEDMKIAS